VQRHNRAEQALRTPVIRRKLCFCSQSGSGLRTTERLLSITQPCRQNGRNLLRYPTEAAPPIVRDFLYPPCCRPTERLRVHLFPARGILNQANRL
jgi:hypothetical protein